MSAEKRGAPRRGSVEQLRRANGTTYFRARITLNDRSRARVDVPATYSTPAGGKTARERAELYALALQEREDETGELLARRNARLAEEKQKHDATDGETCEDYFDRFLEQRTSSGRVRRGRDLQSAWDRWISPKIGKKPIAGLTRDDVEDVRDLLDEAVTRRRTEGRGAGLSGARARNVWSVLTSMMKEASSSKRRELRVRTDNPCATVQPPEKTEPRRKAFFFPVEFLALIGCQSIPREWRELYAIACYLYFRPGELRALEWADVDFVAGLVHVTKGYDEDSKTVGPPKTSEGIRDVPIPPALMPLLEAMRARAPKEGGLVVPLLAASPEDRRAKMLRLHLAMAKITRPRLTENTEVTRMVDFRTWRDTGITWLALQGLPLERMKKRAGHKDISTTLGYVKAAEDLTGTIGAPFPELPKELLGTAPPAEQESAPTAARATTRPRILFGRIMAKSRKRARMPGKTAERAGFEPAVGF